jgi:hypothetical protein
VEVFLAFLRLGLTSFGGPIAHLGYFQRDVFGRIWHRSGLAWTIVLVCGVPRRSKDRKSDWLVGWMMVSFRDPSSSDAPGERPAALWNRLRPSPGTRALLAGANATVVGILLAALYQGIAATKHMLFRQPNTNIGLKLE